MSAPVEETLAWEAEQRPRAATAAVVGGLLTLTGSALTLLALSDYPSEDDGFISVTEALSARLNGAAPREPSLRAAEVGERLDNAGLLWAGAIASSVAVLLAAFALFYLYRATRARSDTVSRIPLFATILAGTLYPLGHIVSEAAVLLSDRPADAEEARDIYRSTGYLVGETLEFFGNFALGLAFVLVGLNAMRVGLLTRFLGLLGIIVGILAVVQLDLPQLIRSLWLVGVGLIIAGRIVTRPPAWETGRAQPWPTQQQIREAREQADRGTNVPPSAEHAPTATEKPAQPAQPKRKRKKRR